MRKLAAFQPCAQDVRMWEVEPEQSIRQIIHIIGHVFSAYDGTDESRSLAGMEIDSRVHALCFQPNRL
jgi:hypothetical protein